MYLQRPCTRDKTIKVWNTTTGKCAQTLTGHESSVLALLALPSGGFLSGSADSTVRRWEGEGEAGAPSQVMRGHADTVRGLALMPGVGFLTASHDCTARMWTHGGDCAVVFAGHTALVYAVAALANTGGVVTGSEDNTARVWRASDGACLQTIPHPGCVWSVDAFVDNGGDVATCCADGVARVWTRDSGRADPAAAAAMAAAMTAAEEERARANLADQQSKIKTEPPTALLSPGESDGATKIIKETDGTIMAYAWSAGTASWEKLGEVTGVGGGGGGGGKKQYQGAEYDYVFDVAMEEGQPSLKLPFNDGDDPYVAADLFLENNGLPEAFRGQIVDFIVQNASVGASGPNVDPFTGAGAYVPGGGGGRGGGGFGGDPFTGGGAYVPGGGSNSGRGGYGGGGGGGGGSVDPFTGGGAYVPGGGGAAAQANGGGLKYVPMKTCLFFESAKFDGILKKLAEFGADETAMQECAAAANGVGGDMSSTASAAFVNVLNTWPAEKLFPVLDLARMLALRRGNDVGADVAGAMATAAARAVAGPSASAPNLLTAGRLFCNAFKHPATRDVFLLTASDVLVRYLPLCIVFSTPHNPSRRRVIVPGSAVQSQDQILPAATSKPSSPSRGRIPISSRRFPSTRVHRAVGATVLSGGFSFAVLGGPRTNQPLARLGTYFLLHKIKFHNQPSFFYSKNTYGLMRTRYVFTLSHISLFTSRLIYFLIFSPPQDGLAASASAAAKPPARLALATALLNLSVCATSNASNASGAAAELAVQAISAGSELLLSAPEDDEDSRFRCLLALGTLATASSESKSLAVDLGLGDVAATLAVSNPGKVRDAANDLKTVLSK